MERRGANRRGLFVVVDGVDGVGKGEVERTIISYEQKMGKKVLDTVAFSGAHSKGLPEPHDFWNPPDVHYHTLSTAEPTYAGIGHNIRFEMIAKNGRSYSSTAQIDAYSLDRIVQMKRVVIPALENGLNVIQARCCAATLAYQTLIAQDEGKSQKAVRKYILQKEGNRLQLEYAPNLLIIPTINDANELMRRLAERAKTAKDDNSIFENAKFQARLSKVFKSRWLKKVFEERGTRVEYLNAGISEQSTREQGLEIYKRFLDSLRKEY